MKIALLTNGIYPFSIGGMQKHSYYLTRYFAQKDIFVDVYYFNSNKSKERDPKNHFSPEELKRITFCEINFPSSVNFPGHYLFNSYRYSKSVYALLRQNIDEVDFIYAQSFSGWKLLEEKKKNNSLPPVGINFHGLEMFQLTANLRSKLEQYLFRYPVKSCLQKTDIAFSLGGKLTNIIKKNAGNNATVFETPIGIEDKWINKKAKPTRGQRKFVFIGRYERRKGIQELNRAIKKITANHEFDFEFIGPIPKKSQLSLANCHYYGPIFDEQKIIDIVSDCDILVCPSYSEGMPTVILEAMSRGLAVIATDVGAVNELVSSQTGWLIEPANQLQLEQTLRETIKISDKQLQQKKENALKLVKEKFTWKNVIEITLNNIKLYKDNF